MADQKQSLRTKVLSQEQHADLVKKLEFDKQIETMKLAGSKYIQKQIECEETHPEFKAACVAELEKRYPKDEKQEE